MFCLETCSPCFFRFSRNARANALQLSREKAQCLWELEATERLWSWEDYLSSPGHYVGGQKFDSA